MKWQIYEMLKGNRELDTQILEKATTQEMQEAIIEYAMSYEK
jgi:hypothetical protein